MGKRQVVWRCAKPQMKQEDIEKVLQPETQAQKEISIPVRPFTNKSKTIKRDSQQQKKITEDKNSREQKTEGVAGVSKQDSGRNLSNYICKKTFTIPPKHDLNWLSYPYNSSDRFTLENRANKVKERVLRCTTSNELNQLLFSSKATEVELNWLVDNYLTAAEIKQLHQIQSSIQGNLFSSSSEIVEYKYEDVIAEIDKEMERWRWSTEDGRNYISDRYNQKSRLHLTDEELLEFWNHLRNL